MSWVEQPVAEIRVARRVALASGVFLTTLLAACTEPPPPPQAPAAESLPSAQAEPGGHAGIDAAADRAAATIGGEQIQAVIAEIADDRYEGRSPGSAGDTMARTYIAAQLERLGFEPGTADGGWEQPVELVGVDAAAPPNWQFTRGDQTIDLAWSTDYVAASGVQAERAAIADSELVFVGYGIEAPEYQWDDFKGVDVSGKVLVVLNNDPDWDPALFAGTERLYYGRWVYKHESAERQGAAGVIIIHTTPSAGYPWQVVQSSWSGPQFELPATAASSLQAKAWVTEDAARRLLGPDHDLQALTEQAKRRDFMPVPLGIRTSLELRNTITRTQSANVLGILRGSDADVADEFVIYSAHHDHLGIGEPNANGDPNDKIYNGARDNASGVGMVLAIGNAYATLAQRPRRSIMLLFVAAEEQGLLGSEYYATHPTVAPGKIAANVNYDSGNIWGVTRDITFIGLGKSGLDEIAMTVAAHQGRTLTGDQFPDRGAYYRSDQFNFAKIGVPAFYFSSGTDFVDRPAGWGTSQIDAYTERDYHQPSDELTPAWNFDGMVQDAQFGFLAGLIVANADVLPSWNPGNEFEAARAAAIAATR
jgi:Zn-dependent M28 family amino/carboxypeptidase